MKRASKLLLILILLLSGCTTKVDLYNTDNRDLDTKIKYDQDTVELEKILEDIAKPVPTQQPQKTYTEPIKKVVPVTKTKVEPTPEPIKNVSQNCHPSYSGCLKANASDYDCAGGSGNGPYYTGKVRVTGPDVFGLDRDKDGWGCE